jgi:glycerol-3-phosphate dehydrogenase
VHPELPYLCAEAEYAILSEMATSPRDVLARRLRAAITSSDGGRVAADWVCGRLASLRGWSDERARAELESYR